ncbi:hypothetical protein MLD52_03035 [Puniceicoccaceae bacterium K14]|nr:hypothetical protein [Puniceicoccaceae bacterium K14]
MRRRHLSRNGWLGDKLHMGVEAAVSRYAKQLNDGVRGGAGKFLKVLKSKMA